MRALGFDCGKHAGWGCLDLPDLGARAKGVACGVLDRGIAAGADERVEEALALMVRYEVEVVGVEYVEEVFGRKRFGPNMAGHLLRAAWLGARIYQIAIDHGFAVEKTTAEAWREALVKSPQAKNPAIAATIKTRVAGWPRVSNNHERDGAGVALYVAERAIRRARRLPL